MILTFVDDMLNTIAAHHITELFAHISIDCIVDTFTRRENMHTKLWWEIMGTAWDWKFGIIAIILTGYVEFFTAKRIERVWVKKYILLKTRENNQFKLNRIVMQGACHAWMRGVFSKCRMKIFLYNKYK